MSMLHSGFFLPWLESNPYRLVRPSRWDVISEERSQIVRQMNGSGSRAFPRISRLDKGKAAADYFPL